MNKKVNRKVSKIKHTLSNKNTQKKPKTKGKTTKKKTRREWTVSDVLDFCTDTELPLDLVLAIADTKIPIYTMNLKSTHDSNFIFVVDHSVGKKLDAFIEERRLNVQR